MSMLVVIPYSTADWHRAEALCDWHRELCGVPIGHVLLAGAADVHAEIREKLTISAELAFESVSHFARPKDVPHAMQDPETLFFKVAEHIGRVSRWPWLWLESRCVPLNACWLSTLNAAYANQPMRYMGPHLKKGESLVLSPVSIYPPTAVNDLKAKRDLLPMSSKSPLIQFGQWKSDSSMNMIRPDAVLFDGCRTNALMDTLRPVASNRCPLIGTPADIAEINPRAVAIRINHA